MISFIVLKPAGSQDIELANGHSVQSPTFAENGEIAKAQTSGGRSTGTTERWPQQHVAVVAPSEGLKFAGAEYIYDKVIKHGPFGEPPKHVVLDCTRFSGFDSGTVQTLATVGEVLKKHSLQFVLANVPADLDTALTRYESKLARAGDVDDALRVIQELIVAAHDSSSPTGALDHTRGSDVVADLQLEDVAVVLPASGGPNLASTATGPHSGCAPSVLATAAASLPRGSGGTASLRDKPASDSSARLLQHAEDAEESNYL